MGRHRRNEPETTAFGMVVRRRPADESGQFQPEPDEFGRRDTRPDGYDVADALRALPADETAPMPVIPEPEPPDWSAGPGKAGRRLMWLAAAVAVVLISASCGLMLSGSGEPSGAGSGRSPAVRPSGEDSSEPAARIPEPAATATRQVPGPTVTVRQTETERASQSAGPSARPEPGPTVTVTRTASPRVLVSPGPTVTVTRTRFLPGPTVTVTQLLTLPAVVPSP